MAKAKLVIGSKNYSSWSLRGWLLAKFAGLDFETETVSPDDPSARAELLLLSPSFLVPCLYHDGAKVWETLAIAEYLGENCPDARLLPEERVARAWCRSVSAEMQSGFRAVRSALPMNLRAHYPNYRIYTGVQQDIERIVEIWNECLTASGGPFLFGSRSMADAMYAPVATRFRTYDVKLDPVSAAYTAHLLALPEMIEWREGALAEPEEVPEFEAEF